MRFAYQTIIFGDRFADRKELESAIAFIADCGFHGVEVFQSPRELTSVGISSGEDLKVLLAKRGLELLGLAGGGLLERKTFLGTIKGPYLYSDVFPESEVLEALTDGNRVALHPHAFKPIHNMADATRWLKHPRFERFTERKLLTLIPDTAHSHIVWDNTVDICRRFRNNLAALHIKGWNAAYGRMSQRYSRGFCPIGEGDADILAVLNEVAQPQYKDIWVVVEEDHTQLSPEYAIRSAADTLRKWGYPVDGKRNLEPNVRSMPLAPIDDLAAFELQLRRGLESISESDPDRFYTLGLNVVRGAAGLDTAALIGVSEIEELTDHLSTSGPVPLYSLLAVSPARSRPIETPKWRHEELDTGRKSYPANPSVLSDVDSAFWPVGTDRWLGWVPNPFNPNQSRYILAVYTRTSSPIDQQRLNIMAACLGRYLDNRLDEACLLAANRIALMATTAMRLEDFLRRLREEIKARCHCEQAVIFVADPAATKLFPLGSDDALTWVSSRNGPNDRCYNILDDRKTRTVTVFREKVPQRTQERAVITKGICRMRVEHQDSDGNIFVVAAPMIDALGKADGVIRCANRLVDGGIRLFHDDDLALLDSMLQSSLPRINTLRGEWAQRSQLRKVTHELKRPLMVIRAAIDSIHREWQDRERRFRQQGFEALPLPWFDDVQSWCGIMRLQLLNPDYLAVDSRKIRLDIEPVNFLPDVLAPIVRWMARELDVRRLPVRRVVNGLEEFTISQGSHPYLTRLFVDRNMFQQIFFNLLDNAIKYARRNEPDTFSIEIRSTVTDTDIEIRVRDAGIGVEDVANLELLFEDGVRGENAWRQDLNGTGYGLWVVRRLVELHHGRIAITKRKDPTEFTLSFPTYLRNENWYELERRHQTLQ